MNSRFTSFGTLLVTLFLMEHLYLEKFLLLSQDSSIFLQFIFTFVIGDSCASAESVTE